MTIQDVKRSLNHKVKIKGYDTTFEFTACIFKLGQNGYYYAAELYDKNTNSAVICKLEDIERVDQ